MAKLRLLAGSHVQWDDDGFERIYARGEVFESSDRALLQDRMRHEVLSDDAKVSPGAIHSTRTRAGSKAEQIKVSGKFPEIGTTKISNQENPPPKISTGVKEGNPTDPDEELLETYKALTFEELKTRAKSLGIDLKGKNKDELAAAVMKSELSD